MRFTNACIKINMQIFLFFIIIFPFCTVKFRYLSYSREIMFFYEILKLISLGFFLVKFYYYIELKNGLLWGAFIYEMLYLAPSFWNGGFSIRTFYLWGKETYTIFFSILIFCTLLKISYTKTIKITYYIISFWINMHVIVGELSYVQVLGIRTRFGDYFIIAIILLFVGKQAMNERFNLYDYLFILLSVYYIFKYRISTMIVLLIVLLFITMFEKSYYVNKICNYYFLVSSALILNFAILFGRIQNVFSWLIVDILHEDISLNARTYIWDAVISDMRNLQYPLLGRGIFGELDRVISMYITAYDGGHLGPRQAHNQILSVLYWTGIGGCISYVYSIIISGIKLTKCANMKMVQFFSCGMFLLCLSMITELAGDTHYFWIYLSFMYCVQYYKPKDNYSKKGVEGA